MEDGHENKENISPRYAVTQSADKHFEGKSIVELQQGSCSPGEEASFYSLEQAQRQLGDRVDTNPEMMTNHYSLIASDAILILVHQQLHCI